MDKGSGKYKFLLVLQVLTIVSFKILVTLDQYFERNHWMGKLFLSPFTVWKRFHLLVLSRLAGNIITFAPFFQLVIIIPFWAKPCPVRFWPFLDKNPFLLPTLADAQDANMILLFGKQPLFDGIICRTQHQNNLSRDDWNEGCWTIFSLHWTRMLSSWAAVLHYSWCACVRSLSACHLNFGLITAQTCTCQFPSSRPCFHEHSTRMAEWSRKARRKTLDGLNNIHGVSRRDAAGSGVLKTSHHLYVFTDPSAARNMHKVASTGI